MRTGLIAVGIAAALAGCVSAKPVAGIETPLGRELSLRLPVAPGYPVAFSGVQTVVGKYGDRRASFQAVLELSPDVVDVVLTAVNGPRILNVHWTKDGIVEERTLLAPAELKGVNVLGDIFVSLWPLKQVQAALPEGVEISEIGPVRRVTSAGRAIVEVDLLDETDTLMVQELRHLDFGYTMTITTEHDR